MKQNLSNLTEEDIEEIEQWLEGSPTRCPRPFGACEICEAVFPSSPHPEPPRRRQGACPCPRLGVEYVSKVAKKIVRDWRKR